MTPAGGLSRVGRVWLIGAGNMGGALLARWRAAGLEAIEVVDPHAGGDALASLPATGTPDVVVLAVKPQVWREATADLPGRIGAGTLVVSVMAGVRVAALQTAFPAATVVRTMPNTPARIGAGITAVFAPTADAVARTEVGALFAPAGAVEWLDREDEFDAVTAVSGSGPGYLFAFIEALAAAGEAAGLPPDRAARLARATVTGAAVLAAASRHETPEALRTAVTSPGGTTAAGIGVLVPRLAPLLRDTVAAARDRSRELGRLA